MPSLRLLTLHACGLTALPADAFAATPALQSLYLSDNPGVVLAPGLFDGMTALTLLVCCAVAPCPAAALPGCPIPPPALLQRRNCTVSTSPSHCVAFLHL